MKEGAWKEWLTRPTFTPLFIGPLMQAYAENVKEVLSTGLTEHLFFSTDGGVKWHVRGDELEKMGRKAMLKTRKEKNFAEKEKRRCIETCEDLVNTSLEMAQKDLEGKSNDKLYDFFSKFLKKLRNFVVYLAIPAVVDNFLSGEVKERIEETLDKRGEAHLTDEYFNYLTWTEKRPDSTREEIRLLEIALGEEEGRNGKKLRLRRLISQHAEKYGWLSTYAFHHEPADEGFFMERLEKIENPEKELEKRKQKRRGGRRKFEETMEKLNPDEDLSELIQTLRGYVYLRTYRTDMLRKAFYYIQEILGEIGSRIDMTKNELSYFRVREVEEALLENDVPPPKEIEERKEHFLALKKGGAFRIFSQGGKIGEIKARELERLEGGAVEVLKGEGIYGGKAKGEVKKVAGQENEEKINEGDILVTTMTTPDMHSMIVRSSAIVTDEGGTTSHAALVSRELQIPCVIGTRKATKVLQNGDTVEVNSKKGEVKKVRGE